MPPTPAANEVPAERSSPWVQYFRDDLADAVNQFNDRVDSIAGSHHAGACRGATPACHAAWREHNG